MRSYNSPITYETYYILVDAWMHTFLLHQRSSSSLGRPSSSSSPHGLSTQRLEQDTYHQHQGAPLVHLKQHKELPHNIMN